MGPNGALSWAVLKERCSLFRSVDELFSRIEFRVLAIVGALSKRTVEMAMKALLQAEIFILAIELIVQKCECL